SDSADAGSFINIDELFCRRIFTGNENVTEQNGERFVTHEISRHQNGMPQTQRLLLPCIADLNHITDAADHFRLIFLAVFLEETLEHGSVIEMIFDGILAFAGDDDDVLDPRSD